jgi:hypothetical protein
MFVCSVLLRSDEWVDTTQGDVAEKTVAWIFLVLQSRDAMTCLKEKVRYLFFGSYSTLALWLGIDKYLGDSTSSSSIYDIDLSH